MRASRPLREEPAPPEALSVYSRAMVQFRALLPELLEFEPLAGDGLAVLYRLSRMWRCGACWCSYYHIRAPCLNGM